MTGSTGPTLAAEPPLDARDRSGRTVDAWLAAQLASVDGPMAELRGAPADPARFVTVRLAGSSVLARPEALPVAWAALGGVCVTLCLPTVEAMDGLFDELRRVLRPAGTLAVLVPSRPSLTERRAWRPVHRALGGRPRFRHESARDRLEWLFASADFAVLADVRRTFWLPAPEPDLDPARAVIILTALVEAGLWPPDLPAEGLRRAAEALAGSGGRLPIPLRLVTGRR